jgi:hypothetical protein
VGPTDEDADPHATRILLPAAEERAMYDAEFEDLYRRIKARLVDDAKVDPVLMYLVTSRPELVVQFEPRIVKVDAREGTRGRVALLIQEGYFTEEGRAPGTVRHELRRRGNDPGSGGTLYDVLKGFTRDGFLLLEGDKYRLAPGVVIRKDELVSA